MTPIRAIIAALGHEREIGEGNTLPWNLPADRKKFREITEGHTVIMGRKTYESIIKSLGKLLINRTNIVVTRDKDFQALPGCIVTHSLEEAVAAAGQDEKVFFIGGASIYEQALPTADEMCLTEIDASFPNADAFFPKFDRDDWQIVQSVPLPPSGPNPINAYFVVYERKK